MSEKGVEKRLNAITRGWYKPPRAIKKHFFEIETGDKSATSRCNGWTMNNPHPPLEATKGAYGGDEIVQYCSPCFMKSDWGTGGN